MDESWKMRLGSNLPRRKSIEETRTTLKPEDFNDVFGGPPQTILSRKKSVPDFTYSYQDVFQSPECDFSSKNGRHVPVFGIQGEGRRKGVYKRNGHGFSNDIFGSDEDGRSSKGYSKSKSNSSSVLSSEDLSPLRNSVVEDVFFSSFSTKLRPINIPSPMSSSSISVPEQRSVQGNSDIPPWPQPPSIKSRFLEKDLINKNYKTSSPIKFFKSSSSPETISIKPISYQSIKASFDDIEIDSPSSGVSSLCNRNLDINSIFHGKSLQEEEEETMSSYTIEINREKSKGTKDEPVVALDEVITWAKETSQKSLEARISGATGACQRQNVSPSATEPYAERKGRFTMHEHWNQQQDGDGRARFLLVNEKLRSWMTEERQQSEKMSTTSAPNWGGM